MQKDKKNYTHFFKPLLDDLKRLEAGVQIGGKTVKMGLICYSADNLEASIVGGFSQYYSSFDVCQICHQQHQDLPEISGIPKAAPWTREEYDAAVENLKPGVRREFGCMINKLQSFHCIGQMPTDVMHTFCEKVASHDLMSVLKVLVSSQLFTFDENNKLLRDVKLGDYEASDWPPSIQRMCACVHSHVCGSPPRANAILLLEHFERKR